MPSVARLEITPSPGPFSIYASNVLVGKVAVVTGLSEAIAATRAAREDPNVYVPGLYIAGPEGAAAAWFAAWRNEPETRELTVHDHARDLRVAVTGAAIGATVDGTWYDLVIRTAIRLNGT